MNPFEKIKTFFKGKEGEEAIEDVERETERQLQAGEMTPEQIDAAAEAARKAQQEGKKIEDPQ